MYQKRWIFIGFTFSIVLWGWNVQAAHHCENHGDLNANFCDNNYDLVADAPQDKNRFVDPSRLGFSYSTTKKPEKYKKLYTPFLNHLAACTGKPTEYYGVKTKAAEIEAMRLGRIHIAGFSTGALPQAVKIGGVQPFAMQGDENGPHGYRILVIVRKNSPYQTLNELKGKRFAHANPSSNSGHIAPMALFPEAGINPGIDYEILFSGNHQKSVLGVFSGKYDAATTNTHAFRKPDVAKITSLDDFRVLYESPMFPGTGLTLAHNLNPQLAQKIKTCTYQFRFGKNYQKRYSGADRLVPIDYQRDWKIVRDIAAVNDARK